MIRVRTRTRRPRTVSTTRYAGVNFPPPLTKEEGPPPQVDSDQKAWAAFVNETLMGAMPEIDPELALKLQGAGPGADQIDL